MIRLLAALFLLIGGIKVAGPWTKYLQDQDILFASPLQEENSKGQGTDGKEKHEQEQTFPESLSTISANAGLLVKYPSDSYQFVPTHHEEPSCPPPNQA